MCTADTGLKQQTVEESLQMYLATRIKMHVGRNPISGNELLRALNVK